MNPADAGTLSARRRPGFLTHVGLWALTLVVAVVAGGLLTLLPEAPPTPAP